MALWDSVLLAAVGGGLTTLGTWLGFRWQAREARQVRSEQLVRDDRFRLHKERMESYASFLREVGDARRALARFAASGNDPSEARRAARDQRNSLWKEYTTLSLIGAKDVVDAASSVLQLVTAVAWGDVRFDDKHYDDLVGVYMESARSDLLAQAALSPTPTGGTTTHRDGLGES
jgi:hypothetical protein